MYHKLMFFWLFIKKFAWVENNEYERNIRLDLDRTFPERNDFHDKNPN